MNKYFPRMVALLLVPCLAGDPSANALATILRSPRRPAEDGRPDVWRPVTASAFSDSRAPAWERRCCPSVFNQEAIPARGRQFLHEPRLDPDRLSAAQMKATAHVVPARADSSAKRWFPNSGWNRLRPLVMGGSVIAGLAGLVWCAISFMGLYFPG